MQTGNGTWEVSTVRTNTVTDARGNVSTYLVSTRGGMGRVTQATGPCSTCGGGQGPTGTWVHDVDGNITSYTDATENTWTYTYDENGDLLTETSPAPMNGVTSYQYFPDGRLKKRTDALGGWVSYTYGPAGPLTITQSVTPLETRQTTMTYFANGKLHTIVDPLGHTTTLGYHPTFGRLDHGHEPSSGRPLPSVMTRWEGEPAFKTL